MNLDAKSVSGSNTKNLPRFFDRIGASLYKGIAEPGQTLAGDLRDQDIAQKTDISVAMFIVLWWNDVRPGM